MTRRVIGSDKPKAYRCAVYARKSSEEGLDQSFNSLDAQWEACEAYIKSQAHEGWSSIPTRYDDGGYSGGSMERPALQRLLKEVAEGRIDIIVVYKVDRLTRSLADFAKIIELLDKHGVSFVSITQQFSTTTSMGRLTLNVLLSFAQFEREVTGERIRDKIAASKRKGMWMGGNPPLGYDIANRTLALNKPEAERVRMIFERYLKVGTVAALADDLRQRGIRSKRWKTAAGKVVGGTQFSRGAIYHLLNNRIYLGEITHRGKTFAGQHPAILSRDLWEKVQKQLASNRYSSTGVAKTASRAFLKSLLFDDQGNPMSPSYTKKRNGSRYRYYVSQEVLQHQQGPTASLSRIAAPAIESFVQDQVIARLSKSSQAALAGLSSGARVSRIHHLLKRVDVAAEQVKITLLRSDRTTLPHLHLKADSNGVASDDSETLTITAGIRLRSWAGKAVIEEPAGVNPQRPRMDHALISAVARAHRWKESLLRGNARSLDDVANQDGCTSQYVRQLLKLAFLAPEFVEAILTGRQPIGLRLTTLAQKPLPLSWREQRDTFAWEVNLQNVPR